MLTLNNLAGGGLGVDRRGGRFLRWGRSLMGTAIPMQPCCLLCQVDPRVYECDNAGRAYTKSSLARVGKGGVFEPRSRGLHNVSAMTATDAPAMALGG